MRDHFCFTDHGCRNNESVHVHMFLRSPLWGRVWAARCYARSPCARVAASTPHWPASPRRAVELWEWTTQLTSAAHVWNPRALVRGYRIMKILIRYVESCVYLYFSSSLSFTSLSDWSWSSNCWILFMASWFNWSNALFYIHVAVSSQQKCIKYGCD